jgi:hypothetical protein
MDGYSEMNCSTSSVAKTKPKSVDICTEKACEITRYNVSRLMSAQCMFKVRTNGGRFIAKIGVGCSKCFQFCEAKCA